MVRNSTLIPGRPSGVSAGVSSRSIPASHLQPITDVANPVSLVAASRAHFAVRPVITRRATRIVNASANVSAIVTPLIFMGAPPRRSPPLRPRISMGAPPHIVVLDAPPREKGGEGGLVGRAASRRPAGA